MPLYAERVASADSIATCKRWKTRDETVHTIPWILSVGRKKSNYQKENWMQIRLGKGLRSARFPEDAPSPKVGLPPPPDGLAKIRRASEFFDPRATSKKTLLTG